MMSRRYLYLLIVAGVLVSAPVRAMDDEHSFEAVSVASDSSDEGEIKQSQDRALTNKKKTKQNAIVACVKSLFNCCDSSDLAQQKRIAVKNLQKFTQLTGLASRLPRDLIAIVDEYTRELCKVRDIEEIYLSIVSSARLNNTQLLCNLCDLDGRCTLNRVDICSGRKTTEDGSWPYSNFLELPTGDMAMINDYTNVVVVTGRAGSYTIPLPEKPLHHLWPLSHNRLAVCSRSAVYVCNMTTQKIDHVLTFDKSLCEQEINSLNVQELSGRSIVFATDHRIYIFDLNDTTKNKVLEPEVSGELYVGRQAIVVDDAVMVPFRGRREETPGLVDMLLTWRPLAEVNEKMRHETVQKNIEHVKHMRSLGDGSYLKIIDHSYAEDRIVVRDAAGEKSISGIGVHVSDCVAHNGFLFVVTHDNTLKVWCPQVKHCIQSIAFDSAPSSQDTYERNRNRHNERFGDFLHVMGDRIVVKNQAQNMFSVFEYINPHVHELNSLSLKQQVGYAIRKKLKR